LTVERGYDKITAMGARRYLSSHLALRAKQALATQEETAQKRARQRLTNSQQPTSLHIVKVVHKRKVYYLDDDADLTDNILSAAKVDSHDKAKDMIVMARMKGNLNLGNVFKPTIYIEQRLFVEKVMQGYKIQIEFA
jgi:hypothetical protein